MKDTKINGDEWVTRKVFEHHLGAFAEGIDALMADYAGDSVIITPTGTYEGETEIRAFFEKFLEDATPEFWAAFKLGTQGVVGDIAYLTWSADPFIPMATDTLLIRNDRILVQTFTPFSR